MDAGIGSYVTPLAARASAGDAAVRVRASAPTPSSGQRRPETRAERVADDRREVSEDSATGSLVYRLVDVGTGTVTSQTPSEAKLKLRAYIDHVFSKKSDSTFDTTV